MEQAIVSGLILGSIYAIIAQGYYITYITTNTLNFGQGDFLMLGALLGLTSIGMLAAAGVPVYLSLILAIAIVIIIKSVLGILLEQVAIKPLRHFFSIGWILSTVAVSIIIRNIAMLIWGRNVIPFPSPLGEKVIRIGTIGIAPHEIFAAISAVVIMALLFFFLKKSLLGKALSAVAFNKDAASLMGINPRFMALFSFALSSALAGIGGILVGPITNTAFYMGAGLGLKAFAVAIIGGLESPGGILVGGLLLGVLEQLVALWDSSFKDASAYVLILIVLAVMPQGLFGARRKEKF
ncbi:branched-chain amino acid ABC transporter permease [Microaerobacter geothermalis]|uniref:branched-chain amino acid ABC transporter permease n=1 Tax=Microaerobacter geothermalis TaxID=674972 RepID=UPI001F481EC1|nr:branched-chain amino acid ABC transporter permease [Microaerobacter geothermalis]MCF6092578.1 branched-chain amino acid ABC transporter permease [Microaerobacter geothermalis]